MILVFELAHVMNCFADDHDLDALLNEEEDSTFFESIRFKRIQEMASSCHNPTAAAPVNSPHFDTSTTWGYLTEIGHEKEVMHMSTSVQRLLIHFYNPAFKNCQTLNEHLQVASIYYSFQLYQPFCRN